MYISATLKGIGTKLAKKLSPDTFKTAKEVGALKQELIEAVNQKDVFAKTAEAAKETAKKASNALDAAKKNIELVKNENIQLDGKLNEQVQKAKKLEFEIGAHESHHKYAERFKNDKLQRGQVSMIDRPDGQNYDFKLDEIITDSQSETRVYDGNIYMKMKKTRDGSTIEHYNVDGKYLASKDPVNPVESIKITDKMMSNEKQTVYKDGSKITEKNISCGSDGSVYECIEMDKNGDIIKQTYDDGASETVRSGLDKFFLNRKEKTCTVETIGYFDVPKNADSSMTHGKNTYTIPYDKYFIELDDANNLIKPLLI